MTKPLAALAALLATSLATSLPAADKPARPTQTVPRVLPLAEARDKEATLLKEVKVPNGFEATLFAAPPAVNYPVFVAAAPDGTLYVSSDGNGSLGREPNLGRVLRLRDRDDDGRADEVTLFVPNVDSPRGLAWDHDRLYVLHPPHLSAYLDQDGDGVAEQEQVLVKNIAFGFKDRPADHTSNGIELGVDGWIYAAIGDFGFLEAEGTDGRKLQLRGGGVVRVRPDGTGLELFCRGTRNILEVALSPLLDGFARDNTNDGGGWDVRFHHFFPLGEHGYPSLYKNFADEIVPPLADYGGGSGCGAAWIDETGWPAAWNNAPYTVDWGHGAIYMHTVEARGAGFVEKQKPVPFVRMTRPTDLDVDGRGRVYAASWKGATFNWAGPEVGYIVRVQPKGHTPSPVPNSDRLDDRELMRGLGAPSHRRRLDAQRALVRRGTNDQRMLVARAIASMRPNPAPGSQEKEDHDHGHPHAGEASLASRVAALFYIRQVGGPQASIALFNLASDPSIAPWALRALTDDPAQFRNIPVSTILGGLKAPDARTRREAAFSLARLGDAKHGRELSKLLADPDPIVVHSAVRALALLGASAPCLSALDTAPVDSPPRAAAMHALGQMHEARTANHLIARINFETNAMRLRGLFTVLCRLYYREGSWRGDSWGTRPDTSGPYYQPEPWEATPQIEATLDQALVRSVGNGAAGLVPELARHKIQSETILNTVVNLTARDPAVIAPAMSLLGRASRVPTNAVPLLASVATAATTDPTARAQAVTALARSSGPDAYPAALAALPRLTDARDRRETAQARDAFLNSSQAADQVALLTRAAAGPDTGTNGTAVWADAALLKLSERRNAPAAARDAARRALDNGWAEAARRVQILEAVALTEHKAYKDKVLSAAADPDPAVARAARRAAAALKIERELKAAGTTDKPAGPLIETMPASDVLAAVVKTRGDVQVGRTVFGRQGCANCHTVAAGEPLRGPFLGNIASIYKRPDLAEAILNPGKSIAQGFTSHRFEMKDGEEHEGFVIQEAADRVTIRNVAAQEVQLPVKEIAKREKLTKSLMPEGLAANLTLQEFASLLDYLESLASP